MTNNKVYKHDICKCPRCQDGYLIVRLNSKTDQVFYGCTNFGSAESPCDFTITLDPNPV